MSRFLVCWNRDGDRVAPAIVAAVDTLRAGEVRRLDRRDVFAWHWPSDWAPGAEDALPLERSGWIGSGVLRLDDRDALRARLRDTGADGPGDDASLAWRALETWGVDAPRRWSGDVALAAVSHTRERLVVARSGVGVRSAFHRAVAGLECVSDDLALLTALAGTPCPISDRAVVEYLRLGHLATPTLTFHEGVTRVPASHALVVERDGRHRLLRHWDLPEPEVRHGRTEQEVVDEFNDLLGRSLRDRLRGPRASLLLSGGLDSPTLAVLAQRAAPDVALTGVTFSWARLLGDDEAIYARLAASAAGLSSHEVIEQAPAEGLPCGGIFSSPEPLPDPEPMLWRAQAARLARIAPVTLLGEDMDALLAPSTLVEQLRTDGVMRTAYAWGEYARTSGRRPWIGARRSVPLLGRWRDARGKAAPAWLRTDMCAQFPLPSDHAPPHPRRSVGARALRQPVWDATCWLEDPRMSGAEVTVLLPFMDPRIIAFCFALPSVPWGQRKFLLRRAMRGALPDALLERPKRPLAGYLDARVAQWSAASAHESLHASVDRWVDLPRLRSALGGGDGKATFVAWRVIELSRWIAQLRTVGA